MRVDVPTLRCDRCLTETQSLTEMAAFAVLRYPNMGGEETWDLCGACWGHFLRWIGDAEIGSQLGEAPGSQHGNDPLEPLTSNPKR
jgi:hypothetical protein